jgi:hypothetical protein
MTTIVLCGRNNDNVISLKLADVLGKYGGAQLFDGESLIRTGDKNNPSFLIYVCERFPKLKIENGILLLKNNFEYDKQLVIPSGFIPVFESHNVNAAAALKGTGLIGVTCGTSCKDTLSVASLDETSATVSLQRNIKTLTDEILEPHEITIKLQKEISPFTLLTICSVLLLSGVSSNGIFSF